LKSYVQRLRHTDWRFAVKDHLITDIELTQAGKKFVSVCITVYWPASAAAFLSKVALHYGGIFSLPADHSWLYHASSWVHLPTDFSATDPLVWNWQRDIPATPEDSVCNILLRTVYQRFYENVIVIFSWSFQGRVSCLSATGHSVRSALCCGTPCRVKWWNARLWKLLDENWSISFLVCHFLDISRVFLSVCPLFYVGGPWSFFT